MKKKFLKFGSLLALGVFLPLTSFAQTNTATSCLEKYKTDSTLGKLFEYITCTISAAIIPTLFALAIAMFLWGVIQFVLNTDDEAKKDKGRSYMVYGILGLAVMASVWGLVKILTNTFAVDNSATGISLPKVPTK